MRTSEGKRVTPCCYRGGHRQDRECSTDGLCMLKQYYKLFITNHICLSLLKLSKPWSQNLEKKNLEEIWKVYMFVEDISGLIKCAWNQDGYGMRKEIWRETKGIQIILNCPDLNICQGDPTRLWPPEFSSICPYKLIRCFTIAQKNTCKFTRQYLPLSS